MHKQQYKASWLRKLIKLKAFTHGNFVDQIEINYYGIKLQWTFCKYDFAVCKISTWFSHLIPINIWETVPTKQGVKIKFFDGITWVNYFFWIRFIRLYNFQVQIVKLLDSYFPFWFSSMLGTLKYFILHWFTLSCGGN